MQQLYQDSFKDRTVYYTSRLISRQVARGREEGLEEGRTLGREEGKLEERAKAEAEKLKSALKFKKSGVPIMDIAENLGLTVEQVENLQ